MQYLLWNSARWSSTGLPMTCARIGDHGGIRPRDLDLERVASWARLDDGVSDRQYTRATAALSDSGVAVGSSRPSPLPRASWPRGSPATRALAAPGRRAASRPR